MINVQINGCKIQGSTAAIEKIERAFQFALNCFEHNIREVDVTLRDINGPKGGVDKTCCAHLRLYPRGVIVARATRMTFEAASAAVRDKIVNAISRSIQKKRSRAAIRRQRRKLESSKE
jgi:putative sigma-54 modulation protein